MRLSSVLIVLSFAFVLMFVSGNTPLFAAPPDVANWTLTFEDNFDGDTLDQGKWFPGYRLGRMEHYARLGFPNEHGRVWRPQPPKVHYVARDGVMSLRVDRDLPKRPTPVTPTVSALSTAIYRCDETTGTFRDEVKFKQKYGWYEIRCRCPKGSGAYSAFWLHQVGAMNQEYLPDGGKKGLSDGALEIDIFELLGNNIDARLNYFNVHYTKDGHYKQKMDFDASAGFHSWAINWEEGRITWYCDDKTVWVYVGPTPPKEMYVLVALFRGGGWAGTIDPNTVFPLDFDIDYIRVWKRK